MIACVVSMHSMTVCVRYVCVCVVSVSICIWEQKQLTNFSACKSNEVRHRE